jgi:preprotein translocase subunit YajC
MNLLSIFLQASGGGMKDFSGLIMFALIFVVFYFFMIRPQQKKQKDIQKAREAMKAGDRIITSGGIFGRIKEVKNNHFIVEIADNVKIKVDKNSVFATAEDAAESK